MQAQAAKGASERCVFSEPSLVSLACRSSAASLNPFLHAASGEAQESAAMTQNPRAKVSPRKSKGAAHEEMDEDSMLAAAIERRNQQQLDASEVTIAPDVFRPGGRLQSPASSALSTPSPSFRQPSFRGSPLDAHAMPPPGASAVTVQAAQRAVGKRSSSVERNDNDGNGAGLVQGKLCGFEIAVIEMSIMGLFSIVDVVLHFFSARQLHQIYGVDTAEPFWAVLVLSMVVSLLFMVSFVSRANSSFDGDGEILQRKMRDENLQTSALLLLSVAHPELLKIFVPASATKSIDYILKIDFARTFLGGVPYIPMALVFIIDHGFGGRWWDSLPGGPLSGNLTTPAVPPCGEEGSGGLPVVDMSCLDEVPPCNISFSPIPPPAPPPPPPFPPWDQSGDSTKLMMVAICWTAVTLGLKLFRAVLYFYARMATAGMREQLHNANAQLAHERQELEGLREYYKYYNNGEAYNSTAGNEWKGSATYPEYGQAGIEAGSYGEAGKSGEASNYY